MSGAVIEVVVSPAPVIEVVVGGIVTDAARLTGTIDPARLPALPYDATGAAATAQAAAAADAAAKVAAEAVLARNAANLTGTIDNLRLPVTAQAATLAATYTRRVTTLKTYVIGDSVDASAIGWYPVAAAMSGQRIRNVGNAGVGGDKTSQMLARIQADVIAYAPDVCIIGGPTNDIAQGVPEATTRANYAAMVAALRAANITPVLRNCPPRDTAGVAPWGTIALVRAEIQRHNAWLANWAESQAIPLIDIYTPLTDPATGGYLSGYTADGTHPSPTGVLAVARYVIAHLPRLFADAQPQPLATTDIVGENLFVGGIFLTDTNADGQANAWSGGVGITKTLTTDAFAVGRWQDITTTGFAYVYQGITSGIIPGHTYELAAKLAVDSGNAGVMFLFSNSSWAQQGTIKYAAQTIDVPLAKSDQAVFRVTAVAPATADRVTVQLYPAASGASSFHVAQVTFRDLTDLGIA